jgi:REP element-mobilizing transposase RayT
MARKRRIEIEGGLYHVITRGNNRQIIFRSERDYRKMLELLERQKGRIPFFLHAYCLMPNHVHLLIERREESISRIMQRLLTRYAQYYNRTYRKVGHVLQGRYKAILCDSDQYLAELVRYIHLNPVRARLVQRPEDWAWSGHRAYIGIDHSRLADVDPLLRRFGAKKNQARERYAEFVLAGRKLGHRAELYQCNGGRILGGEEFVDATIHRIGERGHPRRKSRRKPEKLDVRELVNAGTKATGIRKKRLCGRIRSEAIVLAKEAVIFVGRERGLTNAEMARAMGLDASVVSRRYEAALRKMEASGEIRVLVRRIIRELRNHNAILHA